jgi:hypothetical protein
MNDLLFALGGSGIWGAHAPSRAGFGAFAETIFSDRYQKFRDGEAPLRAREARALPSRKNS